MAAKIARLATRPPFWITEVSVALRSSRPSCSKAEKREYSWQIGSHPGNPGISHFTLRDRIAQLPHEDPKVRTILYRIAHIGRSDQSGKCLGAVRNKNCRASHRDRHSIFYGLDCSAL